MASSSSRSTSSDRTEEEWMALQREEVAELEQAATQARNGQKDDRQLTQLIQKTVQNFQDYANQRSRQARIHVSPFFGPTSATPLENSVKWIGGCRPGAYIRFLYALSGLDIESHLTEFLQGKKVGDLGELTSKQMNMIDALQARTIKEEDKLSSKLASLQENIVDQPIASKIKNECGNVDEALDEHSRCMAGVMEEADELRIKTLKEVVQTILKPLQAVEYLAAAKRMKHCFKIWGKNWGERPLN
ncbi:protein DOG1-like 3 [Solanum dulcamara]|uniref:protein DOG1-like 3 n=1 Tax=Solanum dulcamara TaxID=45834 RepID=UPI002485FDFF|nr:protein DOG1-like 3 [Solanum dulcamara]